MAAFPTENVQRLIFPKARLLCLKVKRHSWSKMAGFVQHYVRYAYFSHITQRCCGLAGTPPQSLPQVGAHKTDAPHMAAGSPGFRVWLCPSGGRYTPVHGCVECVLPE